MPRAGHVLFQGMPAEAAGQGRSPGPLCALLVTKESVSAPAWAGAGPPSNHPVTHLTAPVSESDVPFLDPRPSR